MPPNQISRGVKINGRLRGVASGERSRAAKRAAPRGGGTHEESEPGRHTMRGVQDRTAELFAIADAKCKLRGYAPTPRPRVPKSRFGTMASRIGRALMEVEGRTDRLARLSSKSSLFDDPGAEIAELTSLLKQELASVGASIEALPTCKPSGRQLSPHAEAVLQWLQTNFSHGTERFQAALQQREAILNAKESRLAGISGVATAAAPSTPQAPFSGGRAGRSNLLEGARRRRPHNHVMSPELGAVNGGPAWRAAGGGLPVAGEVAIDMNALTPPPQQQQQQHFWTPRSRQHRDEELSAMKSTLAELGGMFQRFTAVVAEQGETIERIDANTEARRMPPTRAGASRRPTPPALACAGSVAQRGGGPRADPQVPEDDGGQPRPHHQILPRALLLHRALRHGDEIARAASFALQPRVRW